LGYSAASHLPDYFSICKSDLRKQQPDLRANINATNNHAKPRKFALKPHENRKKMPKNRRKSIYIFAIIPNRARSSMSAQTNIENPPSCEGHRPNSDRSPNLRSNFFWFRLLASVPNFYFCF
jgi:hypothetical protein